MDIEEAMGCIRYVLRRNGEIQCYLRALFKTRAGRSKMFGLTEHSPQYLSELEETSDIVHNKCLSNKRISTIRIPERGS